MAIKLYNTLTRKKEIIKPIRKGNIGLYTCGPTVYDYAHIGNWRSFLFEDLLRRTLETSFKVKHVMNITDVGHLVSDADEGEDKMEKGAKREKKTAWEIAEFYTNAFKDDAKQLNILEPSLLCKATDNIQEMIDLIVALEKKEYTYTTDDGVYFDTSKLKNYGRLALLNIKNLKAGARVEMGEKKRPTDFALWKFAKDAKRDMEWDSPFGRGFPGWHIECSAMSIKYLGKTFDIHCGGVDHIPIHHTNEIAQSEAYTGKKFVNYWVHNEHMMIDSKKMSKSLGNFYTLSDIAARGFSPLVFRYFCLSAHYKTQINFTWDAMKNASRTVDSLNNFVFRIKRFGLDTKNKNMTIISEIKKARKEFFSCLYNDLNTPEALSALFRLISFVNRELDEGRADKKSLKNVYDFIMEIDKILAVISEEESEISNENYELVMQRERLRKEKKYAEADALRALLKQHGVLVEDASKGPVWKVIKK